MNLRILFLVFACSLGVHVTAIQCKEYAKEQLSKNYLKGGIWDSSFLQNHPKIAGKLDQFDQGKLCNSLKVLQTANATHRELSKKLKALNYTCVQKPLAVDPKASPLQYLKKDGSSTFNANEAGVARQEVCVDVKEGCVVRIKMDGFPRSKRPEPHSTKAVSMDPAGDPASYDNEAFKVTSSGVPVPKGPDAKFGLAPCPYEDSKACEAWVDEIMAAAHPGLIESSYTAQ